MAYGRAQRIRSIVRLWYGLEIQQQLYHLLHLLFIRMSVSGYGKLYLHGRVLVKGYPCCAASMATPRPAPTCIAVVALW